jgi:DNA-binding response OmpR family regulator
VVLLDIGMPDIDGHEVCARIRSQSWGGNIVLIAVSGWGQEGDRRRSARAGFNMHLVKPVDPDALLRIVRDVMSPERLAKSGWGGRLPVRRLRLLSAGHPATCTATPERSVVPATLVLHPL